MHSCDTKSHIPEDEAFFADVKGASPAKETPSG